MKAAAHPVPRVLWLRLSRHASPFRLWMLVAYLALAVTTFGLYVQSENQRRRDCHERNELRQPVRAALAFVVNLSHTTAHTQGQRLAADLRASEARVFYDGNLKPERC